ncbi:phosphate-binding protein PstS [Undibacterium sp. KW1]|uniref:phosphate ABC transporter substrate-binding protein PstS n=1 Tax=Undibacterium sp. KW1 TaxID=2058624 RepID=UPI001331D417|nr:phosphate ABC transporter substrate-binding protein PstS [Undibacterium sp. KW1]BBB61392.1 phosphate-binding protein PstS [Undibacterium sp. KW1]
MNTRNSLLFPLVLLLSPLVSLPAHADIQGSGSSAAAPLYQKWADAYSKNAGITVTYQASGSSAGIKKIKENSVEFGASDAALSQADLKKDKLIQFPSAISGVVPVINLPGIKTAELRMTGEVLAGIFSGEIISWNDTAITALNPGLRLPNKNIEVIVRQDGSGTTYNFSDYLGKVSKNWQTRYGRNFTIPWNSRLIQVKSSSNIASTLKKTPYAISYIDFNYVTQEKLDYALLQNRDGKFITPSAEAFSAALSNSSWKTDANFEEMLTDKPGQKTWPISMGTFIIMQKRARDAQQTTATMKFFTWAFMRGDRFVNSVDFVRLPDSLQARIFKEMTTVTDKNGNILNWNLSTDPGSKN